MKIELFKILFALLFLSTLTFCSSEEDDDTVLTDENNSEIIDSTFNQVSQIEMNRGKEIYLNNCQTCHQEDGIGVEGAFPTLIDIKAEADIIVNGIEGTTMIAFKDELSDQEIVDVLNYVNNAWGKSFGKITNEEVEKLR